MLRNKKVKIKSGSIKNSSYIWLNRQLNDQYVARSKVDGYRARSAYKIIEIDEKFSIFRKESKVLDLGAAPGSWSQVAIEKVDRTNGLVIALDILGMGHIQGVTSIQGDFYEADTKDKVLKALGNNTFDVVMSDMAPNTIGHRATDHLRIIDLSEASFHFATSVLGNGGHFITKIFMGGVGAELLAIIKKRFQYVRHFKPDSSRKNSSEMYIVAKNFIK